MWMCLLSLLFFFLSLLGVNALTQSPFVRSHSHLDKVGARTFHTRSPKLSPVGEESVIPPPLCFSDTLTPVCWCLWKLCWSRNTNEAWTATSEVFITGNNQGKSLCLHFNQNQVNYFRPKAVISFQQSSSLLGQGKSILQELVLFSVCSLSVCIICGTMWLFHDLISYSLSWYI